MIGEDALACWLYERRHKAGPAGRGAPWLELPSDVREYWRDEAAALSAHLAALEAAGWKCVPTKPTEAMIKAGVDQYEQEQGGMFQGRIRVVVERDIWPAMILAAPAQNGDEVKG